MALHYDYAVVPARVRKPKDKPSVEGTVGVISTWIIAALRNNTYFDIYELNNDILEKLEEFNITPFQKKNGCRKSIFLEEEQCELISLPESHYELSSWSKATVQYNYHISVDKMYYSVPYEYIKYLVDVKTTKNIIEIFYKNIRIASHVRKYGNPNQYQTVIEHMPANHQSYLNWNGDRFILWAEEIGESTTAVIKGILSYYKVEQQGYKSCLALVKSADKYSIERLENACKRALLYSPKPSYKMVDNILKTGSDKIDNTVKNKNDLSESKHGIVRGADYYRRNRND